MGMHGDEAGIAHNMLPMVHVVLVVFSCAL